MTYLELLEKHVARLIQEKGTLSDQVRRNHQSTLNSYLKFIGKTMNSLVGKEFTTEFHHRAVAFTEPISAINRQTAADKLSILRALKRSVDSTTEAIKLRSVTGPSNFHKALHMAMELKGEPPSVVAKAVRTTPRTLTGWLNGAFPMKLGIPPLRRLEAYLGLESGYLESKLEYPRKCVNISAGAPRDKFSERSRANRIDQYALRASELAPSFVSEWRALLKYKTIEHTTGLKRSENGKWRALPLDQVTWTIQKEPLYHPTPNTGCASAARTLSYMRTYFGFLCKGTNEDPAKSGLGLPKNEIQSLAMLVIPEFVNDHLEFMKARSGGLVHSGHVVVGAILCNLTDPVYGYLTQQPKFLEKVQAYAKGRSWEELCAETFRLGSMWGKAGRGKKSRDPKVPIAKLLNLEDGLAPIKRAIQKLDAAAAMTAPGGSTQATYKRNALLLALAVNNPLRLRTLTITKYIAPDDFKSEYQTNLYKKSDGRWWLRFYSGDFKNDGGKPENYDAQLSRKLNQRLEEYLEIYRPVLIKRNPECPWLFPSSLGGKLKKPECIFPSIAKNYIPEVTRMGAHALRHLVATDFLKRNPKEYVSLAKLLHDQLETVLKHYAHGQMESAFNAHEESLASFYDGI